MSQTEPFPPYAIEDSSVGSFQINEQTFKQRSLFFSKLFHTAIPVHESGDHYIKQKSKHGLATKIEEVLPVKQQQRPKTKDKNVMVGKGGCGKFVDRHFSGGFFIFIICLL